MLWMPERDHARSSGTDAGTNDVRRTQTRPNMPEPKYLTPDEVAERYRGEVSTGTLRNWRAMRIGPSYVKVGKGVLYPVAELEAWDQRNVIQCRASR